MHKMLIESLCKDRRGLIFAITNFDCCVFVFFWFFLFVFFLIVRMCLFLNTILEHCSVSLVASVKALLSRNFRLSDNVRGIRRTP